ncbi:hypothetical protein KJ632_05140 [Patescibacteria group bacterium]|nr:hypothetical protein [Patescibacteria group bacterium]
MLTKEQALKIWSDQIQKGSLSILTQDDGFFEDKDENLFGAQVFFEYTKQLRNPNGEIREFESSQDGIEDFFGWLNAKAQEEKENTDYPKLISKLRRGVMEGSLKAEDISNMANVFNTLFIEGEQSRGLSLGDFSGQYLKLRREALNFSKLELDQPAQTSSAIPPAKEIKESQTFQSDKTKETLSKSASPQNQAEITLSPSEQIKLTSAFPELNLGLADFQNWTIDINGQLQMPTNLVSKIVNLDEYRQQEFVMTLRDQKGFGDAHAKIAPNQKFPKVISITDNSGDKTISLKVKILEDRELGINRESKIRRTTNIQGGGINKLSLNIPDTSLNLTKTTKIGYSGNLETKLNQVRSTGEGTRQDLTDEDGINAQRMKQALNDNRKGVSSTTAKSPKKSGIWKWVAGVGSTGAFMKIASAGMLSDSTSIHQTVTHIFKIIFS